MKKIKRMDFYAAVQGMAPKPPDGTLRPDFDGMQAVENCIIEAVTDAAGKHAQDIYIKWLREQSKHPLATEAGWEEMAKKNPLITRATFEALGHDLHIGDLVSIDALGREIGPEMRVLDRYDETETYWLVPAEDVPLDE